VTLKSDRNYQATAFQHGSESPDQVTGYGGVSQKSVPAKECQGLKYEYNRGTLSPADGKGDISGAVAFLL